MKFFLPPLALEQHIAILGKTGSGKTNTGKVIVEHVFDEFERVCILDPVKSDWWGLTASGDGKRAGLPFYILGGPYGHLPLHPHSGKAVAALVASGALKYSILDMVDFPPGGQTRFFADFAPVLLQNMRGVLRLVLGEAHEFAPKERVGLDKESMSVHWAKKLAIAGRMKGIRMLVETQRTQQLHNALLGSADTVIVQRMTFPADQEVVSKWLKGAVKDKDKRAQIESGLGDTATGSGWVYSGEANILEQVKFPKAKTYDNTRTPDARDELVQQQVKTAPVDVEELRTILGKTAQEALANDPAALRKQIAALTADLAKLRESKLVPVKPFGEKELDIARRAGWREGYEAGANEQSQQMAEKALARTQAVVDHIRALCDKELEATARTFASHKVQVPKKGASLPDAHPHHDRTNEGAKRVHTNDVGINPILTREQFEATSAQAASDINHALATPAGLKLRILGAIRWLEDKGISPAPRPAVGAIAQCTADEGYGKRMIGELQTEKLVSYPGPGLLELTATGRSFALDPPQHETLLDAWLERLNGLHRSIVETLAAHPAGLTREFLGAILDKRFDEGYGKRVVGELKTMGALEYPTPGSLKLTRFVLPQ